MRRVTHEQLARAWNNKCAICEQPLVRGGFAKAHITPVEEGGTIGKCISSGSRVFYGNLLPLCDGTQRGLDQLTRKSIMSCHKWFDEEGAWSREEIRQLMRCVIGGKKHPAITITKPPGPWGKTASRRTRTADQIQADIKRIETRPKTDDIGRLVGDIGHLIEKKLSWWSAKGIDIDKVWKLYLQLSEHLDRLSEHLDRGKGRLHLLALRLARRRKKDRQRSLKVVRTNLNALRGNMDIPDRVLLNYELGMLEFSDRRFDAAARILVSYKPPRKSYLESGFALNQAQACVARFECARLNKKRKKLEREAEQLARRLRAIDRTGQFAKKKYLANNEWRLPKVEVRNAWPVTARLHLARMYGQLGNRQKAEQFLKEATERRDRQVRAAAWTNERGRLTHLRTIIPRCGWSRYSRVLLCNAEGHKCYAQGDWPGCVGMLAEALHKIASEDYKNAEYLENVVDCLLAVPRSAITKLDNNISPSIRAQLNLKRSGVCRYRTVLGRLRRKWAARIPTE